MKRFLLTVLLLLAPMIAAADSCAENTLTFYLRNPCTVGDVTIAVQSFSTSIGVDPDTLLVSTMVSGDTFLFFGVHLNVATGDSVTVDMHALFTLPSADYILLQAAANGNNLDSTNSTIEESACLNGIFDPTCTGTLITNGVSGPEAHLIPPSTIDAVQHWVISPTNGSNAIANSPGFGLRLVEDVTSDPVPEPSTLLLLGTGLVSGFSRVLKVRGSRKI